MEHTFLLRYPRVPHGFFLRVYSSETQNVKNFANECSISTQFVIVSNMEDVSGRCGNTVNKPQVTVYRPLEAVTILDINFAS